MGVWEFEFDRMAEDWKSSMDESIWRWGRILLSDNELLSSTSYNCSVRYAMILSFY